MIRGRARACYGADMRSPLIGALCLSLAASLLLGPVLARLRREAPGIEIDLVVSNQARDLQRREGNDIIHARLAEQDPEMAEKLNVGDTQRLLRALEVVEQTGIPLGTWHKKAPEGPVLSCPRLWLALTPDREWLYERCNRRLDQMIRDGGAIEEVKAVLARNLDPALPAMKALGVPEIADFLASRLSEDEMMETIKRQTRRYAKRQMTWVRNKMSEAKCSSAQDLESLKGDFFPFIRQFLLTLGN